MSKRELCFKSLSEEENKHLKIMKIINNSNITREVKRTMLRDDIGMDQDDIDKFLPLIIDNKLEIKNEL